MILADDRSERVVVREAKGRSSSQFPPRIASEESLEELLTKCGNL